MGEALAARNSDRAKDWSPEDHALGRFASHS